MLIEINRKILEQFVKDKEFMYQLVNNWAIETHDHYSWYGLGLHCKTKALMIRPRGATQISIKYHTWSTDYLSENDIEKRVIKYKKL